MSFDLMKVVSALTIEIPLIVSVLSPFELDNGHQNRIGCSMTNISVVQQTNGYLWTGKVDTMKISKISFDEQLTFF